MAERQHARRIMEDDDALANRPGPGAWPLTRLVLAQGLPAASTINDSASLRKDEHTQRTAAARASLAKISPRPPFSPKRLEPRTRCHPTGWPLPLIPSEIQARTHTQKETAAARERLGKQPPPPLFFSSFFFLERLEPRTQCHPTGWRCSRRPSKAPARSASSLKWAPNWTQHRITSTNQHPMTTVAKKRERGRVAE